MTDDDTARATAPAVDQDALAEALRQAGCSIGPYRAAQSAIGDLDREHIDVLAVGQILSTLRREVSDMYERALIASGVLTADDDDARYRDGYRDGWAKAGERIAAAIEAWGERQRAGYVARGAADIARSVPADDNGEGATT